MTTRPLSPLTMLLSRHTRRREVITFIGGAGSKRPVKVVTAAILCFAGVYAEAAEIHDGDTGYIAKNSIWFTDESDLSVWKRVRQTFAPKDVPTALIMWTSSGAPPAMSIASSRARNLPICRSRRQPNTSWS